MSTAAKVKVIFQPSGRRGEVERGINIIEASRQIGVDIEALCGEKKFVASARSALNRAASKKSESSPVWRI